jgi:hypothetical protein
VGLQLHRNTRRPLKCRVVIARYAYLMQKASEASA